ncbi:hypothetical protein PR048_001388 [Dryococelus australis]|uniref:Uncharacterized protein n=1 Tax=Dryococelus australis TaxID=614101 RepID=A0ABQ9IHX0_9NEOP|nr:hypothetical protein PR048_001388 [Dryococelus australis]
MKMCFFPPLDSSTSHSLEKHDISLQGVLKPYERMLPADAKYVMSIIVGLRMNEENRLAATETNVTPAKPGKLRKKEEE